VLSRKCQGFASVCQGWSRSTGEQSGVMTGKGPRARITDRDVQFFLGRGAYSRLARVCFLGLILLLYTGPSAAADFRAPWPDYETFSGPVGADGLENEVPPSGRTPADGDTALFVLPLQFYQRFLTALDGRECPCYPACSQYALQAIRKHGIVRGFLFSIDRLIRESDEIVQGRYILLSRGVRVYDPLEENDFWVTPSEKCGR